MIKKITELKKESLTEQANRLKEAQAQALLRQYTDNLQRADAAKRGK